MDEVIISRCAVILKVINFNYEKKNVNAFDKYCVETAECYVALYNWYYMPVSVPTVLIVWVLHASFQGCHVVPNVIIALGELSEEVQEVKSKCVRH